MVKFLDEPSVTSAEFNFSAKKGTISFVLLSTFRNFAIKI